jgi:Flp pilus assembly protein CpaB
MIRGRRRRGALWLALAGAAGLLAVLLTLRAAGQSPAEGSVLVARAPLPPGLLIDDAVAAEALAPVPVPAGLELSGLLRSSDEALGRRTAVPVAAGEPLTQAALGGAPGTGAAPLAPGERAVAVPLSAAGRSAGLAPGARVDVVASTGEGPAGRTRVVVADAEVLATTEAAGEGELGAPGEAFLRVTSAQALRVTAALNFAREVRLLARPRDEVGSPPPPEVGAP